MAKFDLDKIHEVTDTDILNSVIYTCQGRLDELTEEKRQAAADKITAIAEEAGLSVAEITGLSLKPTPRAKKGKTSRGPAKYKHPDHEKGWTGTGRSPDWMKIHVENGGNKEDFRIPGTE